MTKPTFLSIPRNPSSGSDVRAITQNIEIGTGVAGNGLDKWLTLRDLSNAGIVDIARRFGGTSRETFLPVLPGSNQIQRPPAVANFTVTAGFQVMIIQWDEPQYVGHAYTEIYRSLDDNFANAQRIQTSIPNIASDSVDYGQAFYYWARHVNQNDVKGPLNATAGTYAEAAPNISETIVRLSDQLNETHLAQSLRSRIDLIDTPITGLLDVVTSIQEDVTNLETGSQSTAAALTALGTRIDDNGDSITAISNDFTQLQATVTGVQGSVDANALAISNTNTAVSNLSGTVSAQSTSIQQLSTTVGGNTSTIQTLTSSVDGLNAQWEIKTDVNGLVGGVGFYNDGGQTFFMVNAGVFAVLNPAGGTVNPFFIQDNQVWIDTARIREAAIESSQIQNLVVDKVTGFTSNFVLSTIGTGNISNAYIGNIIQSNVFNAGTGGELIKMDLLMLALSLFGTHQAM